MSGRSRLRPGEIAVLTVIRAGAYVVMGVMIGAGVSDRIVYGLSPVTAPLILAGPAWAVITATRADWQSRGTGLAVAITGAAALAARPAG